mmetsp:Transcript_73576/g.213108  ORF Transcript_73576/g.213108 Transcript_73576/m.213108 type:complete len:238 (+) Transcript_73576:1214-1927(+)
MFEPRLRRPVQVVRHPLLFCVHRGLRLPQVLGEGVFHEPPRGLPHEVVAGGWQERLLELGVVHRRVAQAQVDVHLDDALNQVLVNVLTLALLVDHLQKRVPGVLLALLEDQLVEDRIPTAMERLNGLKLHIVPVQVCEESIHPLDIDLVVGPPLQQLLQQRDVRLALERRKHLTCDVVRHGLAISTVKRFRPIVRGPLCAHVVDGCVQLSIVRLAEHRRGPFRIRILRHCGANAAGV